MIYKQEDLLLACVTGRNVSPAGVRYAQFDIGQTSSGRSTLRRQIVVDFPLAHPLPSSLIYPSFFSPPLTTVDDLVNSACRHLDSAT